MLAAYVSHFNPTAPMQGFAVGERPTPTAPDGWTRVKVKAASLNHHDLSSLRGGEAMRQRGAAGLTEADLPRILGMDAAGVTDDGREVIVYPVVVRSGRIGVLSGAYDGTLAEYVVIPRENAIPKPSGMSFEHAACLSTAWLTAYRMIFEKAQLPSGGTFLVQGASGALATALIMLGKSAGFRVWATGRSEASRSFAAEVGADAVYEMGTRLPDRVDAVMDSVGAATLDHSLKCLRRNGTVVIPGGTSGYSANIDIARIFTMGLRIVGTAMGSSRQLEELVAYCDRHDLVPPVDRVVPLSDVRVGFDAMEQGTLRGKFVARP